MARIPVWFVYPKFRSCYARLLEKGVRFKKFVTLHEGDIIAGTGDTRKAAKENAILWLGYTSSLFEIRSIMGIQYTLLKKVILMEIPLDENTKIILSKTESITSHNPFYILDIECDGEVREILCTNDNFQNQNSIWTGTELQVFRMLIERFGKTLEGISNMSEGFEALNKVFGNDKKEKP